MATETDRVRRYFEGELAGCRMRIVKTRRSAVEWRQSPTESERVESDLAVLSTTNEPTEVDD